MAGKKEVGISVAQSHPHDWQRCYKKSTFNNTCNGLANRCGTAPCYYGGPALGTKPAEQTPVLTDEEMEEMTKDWPVEGSSSCFHSEEKLEQYISCKITYTLHNLYLELNLLPGGGGGGGGGRGWILLDPL